MIAKRISNRGNIRKQAHELHSESVVMPGVQWGNCDVLFTPAYWRFQVNSLTAAEETAANYRLGSSLKAECVACLLGGHGIPAEGGLAAFRAVIADGHLEASNVTHSDILHTLTRPLLLSSDRAVRYRFANTKSLCVAELLNSFSAPATTDHIEIRNWLTEFRGIGLKTASWIVRNWYASDKVAILDIHIHRAGLIAGFFDQSLNITRDYLLMEARFLEFAEAIGVRASSLDAVIWQQMRRAGSLVHRLLAC